MPDSSCTNRRMNTKTLRQRHHRERGRIDSDTAGVPDLFGNKKIFGTLVRFGFSRGAIPPFHVTQSEVVDEDVPFPIVKVTADMRQFVQKAKPEVVQTVLAECQSDHRCAIGPLKRSAIKMRARQMLQAHHQNSVLCQNLLSHPESPLQPAESGHIAQEIRVDGSLFIRDRHGQEKVVFS